MIEGGEMLTYDEAERLEKAAIEAGKPTPREASEVLLAETARRLRAADDADQGTRELLTSLRTRELRARLVPYPHDDHLGYGSIGGLIGRHPMVVKRHLGTFARRRPDLIPPYASRNGQNPSSGRVTTDPGPS
jgi:hypothetical protein